MNATTITSEQAWSRLRPRGYCRQLPPVGVGEPTPPVEIPRRTILLGDATERLKQLQAPPSTVA
jgi:hypothetical protein